MRSKKSLNIKNSKRLGWKRESFTHREVKRLPLFSQCCGAMQEILII